MSLGGCKESLNLAGPSRRRVGAPRACAQTAPQPNNQGFLMVVDAAYLRSSRLRVVR